MKNFLKNIRKGTFPNIIAFSALSVSASAAFYSVSGLSKLFAGASFEVIIMAGSLEVAKLVIASLLYQYWDTINKLLRVYLSVATVILVLITSMGIYGFLNAAYQDTYRQLTIKENKIAFLDQKREFYEKDVERYDEELERISNNISTLSNAKATSIQVRDTASSTGFRSTVSTAELRLSQSRINVEEQNRKSIQAKREQVADSLQKYQLEILDLENNGDVAGELGPLQYLSGLTGINMDKIINYLLLVIIFVFDPLAISLVIAANFAFANAFPKQEEETSIPDVFEDEEFEEWKDETEYLSSSPANKERLNKAIEEIEVNEPEIVKSKEDFLSKLDEIEARMMKDNAMIEEKEKKDDTEFKKYISTAEDKIYAASKTIIEKQKQENQNLSNKIDSLENELEIAHEEIHELDNTTIKIVDSIKHIDDYLKHHEKNYTHNTIDFNTAKLGSVKKDNYINQHKLRSKPIGKNDPYLDKNQDPDYPTKDGDSVITY